MFHTPVLQSKRDFLFEFMVLATDGDPADIWCAADDFVAQGVSIFNKTQWRSPACKGYFRVINSCLPSACVYERFLIFIQPCPSFL